MRTIVWDIDDVLCPLMRSWFDLRWRRQHRDSAIRYEDLSENPPDRVLGISRAEYLASLDEFRSSDEASRLEPNPAVVSWLASYGLEFRHVALTSRPLSSAGEAATWLFQNLGGYFRCFGVVPSRPDRGVPVYDRDKGDFVQWLRIADVLVDDSEENIAAAERVGVRAILYPQPWNRSRLTVDGVMDQLCEEMALGHR